MKIFTHLNPDLDAICSLWAARRFIPGAEHAEVAFRPANWDGAELGPEDLALDLEAGGKGVKGQKGEDGIVHSCFATIVAKYASDEDQAALAPLVRFVDAQDAHGSAVKHLVPEAEPEVQETLAFTGLNAVFRALQAVNRNDYIVLEKMAEILDGMLQAGRARQRAKAEAETKAEVLTGGKVAILRNAKEYATSGVLFESGVQVIVYVDGNNLGLIRHSDQSLRMDHPDLKAVVEEAGEADEWFAHPAGFLYCRGSRKAPAETESKVSPKALAEAAARLLG